MTARLDGFGTTSGGEHVGIATLTGGGLTARVMTWGAALQDLRLAGHEPPLVCGFAEFAHYEKHSPYFGATPGRFANRIGNAQFTLDGTLHRLDANSAGGHTLHGGSHGIGKRIWQVADLGTSHIDLTLDDPDGTMGFPGNCRHTASYRLGGEGEVTITLTTRTDAPTIAGLTHHSYFILDDTGHVLDHEVQVDADRYLAVDDDLIPVQTVPVEGTPFDFRKLTRLGARIEDGFFYDHNLCLSETRRSLRDVACVRSPHSGVSLAVATTEPGLQLYGGHKVDTPVPGLTGQRYGAHAGLCLECQVWPDAPNRSDFPCARLDPDDELRQVTRYTFTLD